MEFSLRPLGFMEFLQNNNHQASESKIEKCSQFFDFRFISFCSFAWRLLFCKNSLRPKGRRLNSCFCVYVWLHIGAETYLRDNH